MAAVFRAFAGYLFLVFMVRVVGRRPGKQMTPFEYVLIFYMGGLTLTALIGDDRSVTNAFCVVITVALTHYAMAWLKDVSPRAGRLLDGTPLVLMERGCLHRETMRKMRFSEDDVMAAARARGLRSLDQIEYAVLERNGEITIFESARNG